MRKLIGMNRWRGWMAALVALFAWGGVATAAEINGGGWTRTTATPTAPTDNLIAGMMPSSIDRKTTRESTTDVRLTDGVYFGGNGVSQTFAQDGYVAYLLGDNAHGYQVHTIRLTTGTWAARDNPSISSIQFRFVGSDEWETVPNSTYSADVNSQGMCIFKASGDFFAQEVAEVKINFGGQENGYVGYGEIEICGSACTSVSGPGYTVRSPADGSEIFVKSGNAVNVSGVTVPDGYEQFQFAETKVLGDLPAGGWQPISALGSVQTFALPAADANLQLYLWFKDADDEFLPMVCAAQTIRYASVRDSESAPVITWTGASSTDAATAGNWSPAQVPVSGDRVVIPSGTANAPVFAAGTYPSSGAYAAFTVASGATAYFASDTSTTYGSGVTVFADVIEIAGTASADARGFPAGSGPKCSTEGAAHSGAAYGLGYTGRQVSCYYAKDTLDAAGELIENPKKPTGLGSGGKGAAGGGAIRLVASSTLTLNGTISANGGTRAAGGSVWLQTTALHGAGSASAIGGKSDRAAGGGAIAVEYETSDFTGAWNVGPAIATASSGECGTIYEPKRFSRGTAANPVTVVLPFDGTWVFDGGDYYWKLSTTAPNEVGVWLDGGTLHLGDHVQTAGWIKLGEWNRHAAHYETKVDFGSIALSNANTMLVLPCAKSQPVINLNRLDIGAGAYLTLGCADISSELGSGQIFKIAGDCVIAGTLYGVGRGNYSGKHAYNDKGAPHGGATGGGAPYGCAWAPMTPGSASYDSGQGNWACRGGGAVKLEVRGALTVGGRIDCRPGDAGYDCRNSGGSIFIEAAHFSGAGTLDAGGSNNSNRYGGGGRIAIYSPDNTFTGTKRVQTTIANGNCSIAGTVFTENSRNVKGYAFGNGPKLACDYDQQSFATTVLSGGANVSSGGSSGNLASSAMCCDRTVTGWSNRLLRWNEKWYLTEDVSGNANVKVDNTARYTITGLVKDTGYKVKVNDTPVLYDGSDDCFPSGPTGTITFEADLANAENTIEVVRATGGGLVIYYR